MVNSMSSSYLMEKEMATHSSILIWDIPWTEEPGGLQSMESQRVGYNLATKQVLTEYINQSLHSFIHNLTRSPDPLWVTSPRLGLY